MVPRSDLWAGHSPRATRGNKPVAAARSAANKRSSSCGDSSGTSGNSRNCAAIRAASPLLPCQGFQRLQEKYPRMIAAAIARQITMMPMEDHAIHGAFAWASNSRGGLLTRVGLILSFAASYHGKPPRRRASRATSGVSPKVNCGGPPSDKQTARPMSKLIGCNHSIENNKRDCFMSIPTRASSVSDGSGFPPSVPLWRQLERRSTHEPIAFDVKKRGHSQSRNLSINVAE